MSGILEPLHVVGCYKAPGAMPFPLTVVTDIPSDYAGCPIAFYTRANGDVVQGATYATSSLGEQIDWSTVPHKAQIKIHKYLDQKYG